MLYRAILIAGLILVTPVVAAAQVRQVTIIWTGNGGDGFILQRKDAHCSVPGTFADIAQLPAGGVLFVDLASPFPYACYRARATLGGAPDSSNSNEAGTLLPQSGGRAHGLSRR
jgi:hypothetical protein